MMKSAITTSRMTAIPMKTPISISLILLVEVEAGCSKPEKIKHGQIKFPLP